MAPTDSKEGVRVSKQLPHLPQASGLQHPGPTEGQMSSPPGGRGGLGPASSCWADSFSDRTLLATCGLSSASPVDKGQNISIV